MTETAPPHPDNIHLQFARGWLELGNVAEAEAELDQVRPENAGFSDVLEVRFQILARQQRYAEALVVAERQVADFPTEFRGHMNRGNALFWLDRSQEAFDTVVRVLDDHPKVAALPYNLACYCMKMDRREEAIRWLDIAMQIGQRKGVIQHALADTDLKDLWEHLRTLDESAED